MIDRIVDFIKKENMLQKGDRVGIAVSGGMDSMALLDVMYNIRSLFEIELGVIHFYHKVRFYGCKTDTFFVQSVSEKLSLPFVFASDDVPFLAEKYGKGIEETGRDRRYEFFHRLIEKGIYNKIALAHTSDDQVETVLMKFLRGGGEGALGGMTSVRDGVFIRPVLNVCKKELTEYAKSKNLVFRMDQTNRDEHFLRNKLRHFLIPLIEKEFNPNFSSIVSRMSDVFRVENNFMETSCEEAIKEIVTFSDSEKIVLNIKKIFSIHLSLRRRLIRHVLYKFLKDNTISYNHVEMILDLACSQTGKKLSLFDIVIIKDYGNLLFLKNEKITVSEYVEEKLNIPGETVCEFFGVKVIAKIEDCNNIDFSGCNRFKAVFDMNKITLPLFLRNRRDGDKFMPFGMKGSKKVKDFLMDSRVPLNKRNVIPIVSTDKDILWIAGMRSDERFKVTSHTKKTLIMEVEYLCSRM